MKIIFSQTPEFLPTVFKWTPPVGMLYLAAVLEKTDVALKIIDPAVDGLTSAQLVERVIQESPDIFGMYITSDTYFTAAKIIRHVKERCPQIIIMAGGPHPTLLAGDIFQNLPVDIVVRGEGEYAVPLIIDRLKHQQSLEGIPNTSFRQDGVVTHNSKTHLIEDIDSIPFPALQYIDYEKYQYTYPVPEKGDLRAINITTTRGCPFNCLFCSNTNLWGTKYRTRSVKNVIEEIKARIDAYGVKFFWIQDDAFNLSRSRVVEFCDCLEKENLQIYWSCILRADNLDKTLLARMKETGLTFSYFAIETINDQLRQTTIGKKLTWEMITRSLTAFNELKMQCGINFMVSLPDETRAMMEENIRFIEQLKLSREGSAVHYNITKIYPGTRLEAEARQRGVLKEGFSWFDEKKLRKYSPGVLTGLYGQIPMYKERLGYIDIFFSLFRWKYSRNFPRGPLVVDNLLAYLWRYLCAIKHPKDVLILCYIALAWGKSHLYRITMRVRQLLERPPSSQRKNTPWT